jgi:hypothetical protein
MVATAKMRRYDPIMTTKTKREPATLPSAAEARLNAAVHAATPDDASKRALFLRAILEQFSRVDHLATARLDAAVRVEQVPTPTSFWSAIEDHLRPVDMGPRGATIMRTAMDIIKTPDAGSPAPADEGDPIWIATSEGTFQIPNAGHPIPTKDILALFAAAVSLYRSPRLPPSEAALFDAAGATEDVAAASTATAASTREFTALLATSLDVAAAAALLGCTPARVRQRLNKERSLYGFKQGVDWCIPRFQFIGSAKKQRLLPGLDVVVPHLREDARPLAVSRFFTLPHSDLEDPSSDEPLSPKEWLAAGHPPEAVIPLAEEI